MAWIKEQTCVICKSCPVIAHHCEGSTWAHNKIKCGHWFLLPICQEHDDVITLGSRRAFREQFGAQSNLWVQLIKQSPIQPPAEVIAAIIDWGR
jgi:hypothetical protein